MKPLSIRSYEGGQFDLVVQAFVFNEGPMLEIDIRDDKSAFTDALLTRAEVVQLRDVIDTWLKETE